MAMIDPNEMCYKRGTADVLKYFKSIALSQEILFDGDPESYRLSTYKDAIGRLVFHLDRSILGVESDSAVIYSQWVPLTWWDHFKREYWKRWWMPRRWLKAAELRKIDTVLRSYRLCPHMKADPDKHHVQFMFTGRCND